MTTNEHCVIEEHHVKPPMNLRRHFSWSAVFVGALVGVGLGFLLNLFGFAIGLSIFTLDNEGAVVLALGGLIGVVIGVIITMTAAGYAAGYLGRDYCSRCHAAILYGFTTWSLALLLSAGIAAHVGNYVATYSNNISHSVFVVPDKANPNLEAAAIETSSPTKENKEHKTVKVMASPSMLALSSFIIFALFFIGAISCCCGASWAMHCKRCVEE